jgi:hypothetical protein
MDSQIQKGDRIRVEGERAGREVSQIWVVEVLDSKGQVRRARREKDGKFGTFYPRAGGTFRVYSLRGRMTTLLSWVTVEKI